MEKVDIFGVAIAETPAGDASKDVPTETPAVVDPAELKKQVDEMSARLNSSLELHAKKDADIRAMAEKIRHQEKGTGASAGGSEQDGDVPFKEIKTSKDLSEDERDDMTDAEIKAMDEMASLKKTVNEMYRALSTPKPQGGKSDVAPTVTATALALAGNDVDKANVIIEAFNGMKFNVADMSTEEITKAVALVAGTVGYQKPREDNVRGGVGKPVTGGSASDPYGVDKIVEQAVKANQTGEDYEL